MQSRAAAVTAMGRVKRPLAPRELRYYKAGICASPCTPPANPRFLLWVAKIVEDTVVLALSRCLSSWEAVAEHRIAAFRFLFRAFNLENGKQQAIWTWRAKKSSTPGGT